MIVSKEWTFNELVENIERLKEEYIFFLAFFSSYNSSLESKRLYNQYIKSIRDLFYQTQMKEWQKDLCWEYMNNYICYPDLMYHVRKLDKKTKK